MTPSTVIQNMSAAQFVNMNDALRTALAQGGDPKTAFASQIAQVKADVNLPGKLTAADRTKYGIT